MAKHEIDLPDAIHIDQVRAALKTLGFDIDPESADFGSLVIAPGSIELKQRFGGGMRIHAVAEWWIDGTHPF